MKLLSRVAVLSLSIIGCVGCDQFTKSWAHEHLYGHASISFLDGMFSLVYAENPGIMLGIGSTLPEDLRFTLFVLFVGMLLVAAIVFALSKPRATMTMVALSLVVGGGVSNVIDRFINHGSVIDFLVVRVGSLESGIFNVADIAITLGVSVLCASFVMAWGKSA